MAELDAVLGGKYRCLLVRQAQDWQARIAALLKEHGWNAVVIRPLQDSVRSGSGPLQYKLTQADASYEIRAMAVGHAQGICIPDQQDAAAFVAAALAPASILA